MIFNPPELPAIEGFTYKRFNGLYERNGKPHIIVIRNIVDNYWWEYDSIQHKWGTWCLIPEPVCKVIIERENEWLKKHRKVLFDFSLDHRRR